MHKNIILTSFVSLLLVTVPHVSAQTMTNGFGSMTNGADATSVDTSGYTNTNYADTSTSGDTGSGDTSSGSDSIFTVDANGNMFIKPGEDYTSAIDLARGNLELGSGATVTKSVRVRSGNVTLGSSAEIHGGVTVDSGSLNLGANAAVTGATVVGGTLTVGSNADMTGSVTVSSSGTITVGSNATIDGTVTSPAGMKVGANADVKMFLSGQTAEIDGKVYQLPGRLISAGSNADVGLPFVPKPKNGAAVVPTATTVTASPTQGTPNENAAPRASDNPARQEPDTTSSNGDTTTTAMANDIVLPDVSNILSEDDVTQYVSDVISSDSNVKNLDLTSEAVNLDYKTPASLFGFIPMSIPTHVAVSKDKNVDVSYPWYSFLMSTNKQAVQDAVSQSVQDALTSSTATDTASNGLSAKIQAAITNSILSAFKNMF